MRVPLITLPHRATIIKFQGSGAYGPSWDEANAKENVRCLIESNTRQTTDSTGTDVTQRAAGVFLPDSGISINDKVRWSDTGQEYTVTEVNPIHLMGPYSVEVVLT